MSDVPLILFPDEPLTCTGAALNAMLGGKGESLHRLHQLGLRIPAGFTITTAACRAYFREQQLAPQGMVHATASVRQGTDEPVALPQTPVILRRPATSLPDELARAVDGALDRLERDTQRKLGDARRPLLLAVRSGAAVSMPGTMATLLHCGLTPSLARSIDTDDSWQAFADLLDRFLNCRRRDRPHTPKGEPRDETPRERCQRLLDEWELQTGRPFPDDPRGAIREAIAAVFDSWNCPPAREYRRAHGIDEDVGTGVTVQQMFPAEVSGVLFTCDPRTGRAARFVVEGVAGLGDALVAGAASPARWFVCPKTGDVEVDETTASNLPPDASALLAKFSRSHLGDLCRSAANLRTEWGCELDVEWGYALGELVYFQVRPIASPPPASAEGGRRRIAEKLRGRAGNGRCVWVRHNLGDTLQFPTPLTWSVVSAFMSGGGGFGDLYRRLGYAPSARVSREGFLELIGGRVYAEIGRLRELFCEDYPFSFDVDQLRRDPTLLDRGPTQFAPAEADPILPWKWPRLARVLWRAARRWPQLLHAAPAQFDSHDEPAVRECVARERSLDFASLNDGELLAVLDRRISALNQFGPGLLLPGTLGANSYKLLEMQLVDLLGPKDGTALAQSFLAGLEDPLLKTKHDRLRQIATDPNRLEDFLAEFGHRAMGEMELSIPRWRESPQLIRSLVHGLRPVGTGAEARREQPAGIDNTFLAAEGQQRQHERLEKSLIDSGVGSLARRPALLLSDLQRLAPYRERGRHLLMMVYTEIRAAIEELARRTQLQGLIYFLNLAELRQLIDLPRGRGGRPDSLRRELSDRQQRWREERLARLPPVIDSSEIDELDMSSEVSVGKGRSHVGVPLSGGRAEGEALLLDDLTGELQTGMILVLATIDAGMLPLLARSAGLVVEQGGILSHGALLARQLGVPAVVLPGACTALAGGERVLVDGDRGLVQSVGTGV